MARSTSILKQTIRQRDFSGGQIDPSAERRDDTKLFKSALRKARNVRPRPSGAASRRPGRTIRYIDGGLHDIVRPVADITFDVTFAALRFTARLTGGAIVSDLVAPWTSAQLAEMSWEVYGRYIFVCHREFTPQVITYDRDAGTWSIADYDFRTDLSGRKKAPFFRFADYGVTLQPSALTGSITLTASAAVFKAGHVGVLMRYAVAAGVAQGRQMLITAVATDGLSATATVIETLPPTFRVTMASVSGYVLGEIVQGDTSGAYGQIVAINNGSTYLDILMVKGFGGFTNSEILVGQQGGSTVSSSTTTGPSYAATELWDEQFMSDLRGWPGAVSTDLTRLILTDFAQLENAIIWSAIAAPDDLEITGEATAAIFELVPQVCRVLYVAGGADEFVLTDQAIFYIPISGDNPLVPGSVEFRRIGSAGAGNVHPVAAADGLIFAGRSAKRLYAIVATGQTTRPYTVQPINELHEDLFDNPIAIAVSAGDQDTNPSAAIYVVNSDGTLAVGFGSAQQQNIGWFPWDGEGAVTAVASRYGDVIFTVSYDLNSGSTVDTVEAIDNGSWLDGSIPLADLVGTDPLRTSTGAEITTSAGAAITVVSGAALPFANETLQGYDTATGLVVGDVTVDEDGRVDIEDTDLASVVLGWNFTPEIEPLLEDAEGGDPVGQRLRRRKVSRVALKVVDTHEITADGHVFGSYVTGGDWSARAAYSKTWPYRQRGRGYDPQVQISQPVPGDMTITEITVELTV